MRIHFLQHKSFDAAELIKRWAGAHGYPWTETYAFQGEQLPSADQFDVLISHGGPQSAYEHDKYPWMMDEYELIHQALNKGKKVFGICLGAQMLATALGAKVKKNHTPEIGWHDVFVTNEPSLAEIKTEKGDYTETYKKCFPPSFSTFNWHYDVFDIPPGATRLFRSAITPNQGFCRGTNVLGLQFHPETVQATLDYLMPMLCPNMVAQYETVHSEANITDGSHNMMHNHTALQTLLDAFCAA